MLLHYFASSLLGLDESSADVLQFKKNQSRNIKQTSASGEADDKGLAVHVKQCLVTSLQNDNW